MTLRMIWMLLFLWALAGCATAPVAPPQAAAPPKTPEALRPGEIVETATGRILSFDELMSALANVQVIYVGETHTSAEDHRVQAKILEGLYAQNPNLELGMEMFPRSAQPILDRFTAGELTEEAFRKEVDWEKVWGFPFSLYEPIFSFARDKQLPILGLNLPVAVVRKISREGMASLTPEERAQVAAEIDPNVAAHRAYIEEEYREHVKGDIKGFDTFYEAQLAWDETMAESVANALRRFTAGEQLVVIIGKGHVAYRFGVPDRALRRVPHAFKVVLPFPYNYPDSLIDPELADYIWVTDLETMPPMPRGRLGIMIEPAKGGLEVLGVVPESPAAKAGILKGDLIVEVNGEPVDSPMAIHKAVVGKGPVHRVKLLRKGRPVVLEVTLPAGQ